MKKIYKNSLILMYLLFFLVLNVSNAKVTLCNAGNICGSGICASRLCINLLPFTDVKNIPNLLAVGCGNVGNLTEEGYCDFVNLYNREYYNYSYSFLGESTIIYNTLKDYLPYYCNVEERSCNRRTGRRKNVVEQVELYDVEDENIYEGEIIHNPLYFNLDIGSEYGILPLRVVPGKNQLKFLISCRANSTIKIYFALDEYLISYLDGISTISDYSNKSFIIYNQTIISYNTSIIINTGLYGPWKEVELNFTTKFSDIGIAFEKNRNCRISYFRINDFFPQYSEVENYPIYNSRVNKLLHYFEQPYSTGICKNDQCWNGFGCVENGSLIYSIEGIQKVAICHNGSIIETKISFDKEYRYVDYCPDDGCLNNARRCVPEFTWDDGMICMDGHWIHDTDFGARMLLDLNKDDLNYIIYCDKSAYKTLKLAALFLNIDNPEKIKNYCIFIGNISKQNGKVYSTQNILILFLSESNIFFRSGGSYSENVFFSAINLSRTMLGYRNSSMGPYVEYTNNTNINQIYVKFGKPVYVYFFNRSNMLILSSINFSNTSFNNSYSSLKERFFSNISLLVLLNNSFNPGYYYGNKVEIFPENIFIRRSTTERVVILSYKDLLLYDEFNYKKLSRASDFTRPYVYLRNSSITQNFIGDFVKEVTNEILRIEDITHTQFLRYVIGHDSLE